MTSLLAFLPGFIWGAVTSIVISRGSLWFWTDWRWWTIAVGGIALYNIGLVRG